MPARPRLPLVVAAVCIVIPFLLQAQSSAPASASAQAAPSTIPVAPSASVPAFDPGSLASGHGKPPISFGDVNAHARLQTRSAMNPFQPQMLQPGILPYGLDSFQPSLSFGNFAGSTGSGLAAGGEFGGSRTSPGGFKRMGGAGIGGRQDNLAPLFPLSNGPAPAPYGSFGSAPLALPSLNQLMRGSFSLPFGSSAGLPPGGLRFTYQGSLRPGGAFSDPGHPNPSAMFTTSDLGNGVFLSAGTGYGIRSTAGAPAASLGNEGGQKHSGTAVNLKLSF